MNIPSDPRDMQKQARREALYIVMRETYRDYFRRKIKDGTLDEMCFQEGDFPEVVASLNSPKVADTDKWYLVTINPASDDVSIPAQVCARIFTYKNFVTSYQWSLEQRSDDPDNPFGYHAHIAFPNLFGLPKSQIITRCYNALKKIDPSSSRNSVHVKMLPQDSAIQYVNKYKHCDEQLGLGPQQSAPLAPEAQQPERNERSERVRAQGRR